MLITFILYFSCTLCIDLFDLHMLKCPFCHIFFEIQDNCFWCDLCHSIYTCPMKFEFWRTFCYWLQHGRLFWIVGAKFRMVNNSAFITFSILSSGSLLNRRSISLVVSLIPHIKMSLIRSSEMSPKYVVAL